MAKINRMTLSEADYKIYFDCEMQVWNENPRKCVCGQLATFSHERTCSRYRKTVDKLFIKTMKLKRKNEKFIKNKIF